MRSLLFAGAAALTLTALPATTSAQNTLAEHHAAMSAAQHAIYETWPPEQRALYESLDRTQQEAFWALDPPLQEYYWTLSPDQQTAWWVLTPEQRVQVQAMTPEARANAWASLANQVRAGVNASPTSVAARTGTPVPGRTARTDAPVVTYSNPGNLTPPPASAMNKSYPVCRGAVQDNCQNAGEGGAPGRSRALGHWPGEPASDRKERGG